MVTALPEIVAAAVVFDGVSVAGSGELRRIIQRKSPKKRMAATKRIMGIIAFSGCFDSGKVRL